MRASLAPGGRGELVLPMSDLLLVQWALWTTITALVGRHEGWGSAS